MADTPPTDLPSTSTGRPMRFSAYQASQLMDILIEEEQDDNTDIPWDNSESESEAEEQEVDRLLDFETSDNLDQEDEERRGLDLATPAKKAKKSGKGVVVGKGKGKGKKKKHHSSFYII